MWRKMVRRSPASVLEEIIYWHDRGVDRFVMYDDSFLYASEDFAKPLLRKIAGLPFPVRIYNPNAVNAAFLDRELAELFVRAGFREVRIGSRIDRSLCTGIDRREGDKDDLRARTTAS
jgi:radical SAM superfamily enzyme YgiQ (UPF0313 family)